MAPETPSVPFTLAAPQQFTRGPRRFFTEFSTNWRWWEVNVGVCLGLNNAYFLTVSFGPWMLDIGARPDYAIEV